MTCCFEGSLLLQHSSSTIKNYIEMKLIQMSLTSRYSLVGGWDLLSDSSAKVRSLHQILNDTQTSADAVSYSTLSAAWSSFWLSWIILTASRIMLAEVSVSSISSKLIYTNAGVMVSSFPLTWIFTCTLPTVFSLFCNTSRNNWRNSLSVMWRFGWDTKIHILRNLL